MESTLPSSACISYIFPDQIHFGFEDANKNSQEGFTNVINNKISINIMKPGAYMLKDKIIPLSSLYESSNGFNLKVIYWTIYKSWSDDERLLLYNILHF